MSDSKLYSIVVPIYGVEKYLRKCIDSLIGQTYKNIEIILVDDGSKDNSPSICDEYALQDQRIRVLHKPNGGLVSARKAGAEIALGEYIFCVDGDDWVGLNYIEICNEVIVQYEPEMVCCGYIQSDEITEIPFHFAVSAGYYNREQMEKHIYPIAIEGEDGSIFPAQLWAKGFKKSLYLPEQLSVIDAIKIGEDGAVVKPSLSKCTSLYVIDECLYYYRYNDTSMTKNKSSYDWNGPRYILQHLMNRIDKDKYDFERQIERRTARDIYTVTFSQFNKNESYRAIKKQIIENLSAEDYKKVLQRCEYKGFKHRLEVFLLKHHILFPIYLFHKIQTR